MGEHSKPKEGAMSNVPTALGAGAMQRPDKMWPLQQKLQPTQFHQVHYYRDPISSIDTYAHRVASQIQKRGQVVNAIGVSIGSVILYRVAEIIPKLINRLAMVSPPPSLNGITTIASYFNPFFLLQISQELSKGTTDVPLTQSPVCAMNEVLYGVKSLEHSFPRERIHIFGSKYDPVSLGEEGARALSKQLSVESTSYDGNMGHFIPETDSGGVVLADIHDWFS